MQIGRVGGVFALVAFMLGAVQAADRSNLEVQRLETLFRQTKRAIGPGTGEVFNLAGGPKGGEMDARSSAIVHDLPELVAIP